MMKRRTPQGHVRNCYTEKHKKTKERIKQDIYQTRSGENNAQSTKAHVKTKTQIANDIVEPHAAWTCAVQATGEERGLEA